MWQRAFPINLDGAWTCVTGLCTDQTRGQRDGKEPGTQHQSLVYDVIRREGNKFGFKKKSAKRKFGNPLHALGGCCGRSFRGPAQDIRSKVKQLSGGPPPPCSRTVLHSRWCLRSTEGGGKRRKKRRTGTPPPRTKKTLSPSWAVHFRLHKPALLCQGSCSSCWMLSQIRAWGVKTV